MTYPKKTIFITLLIAVLAPFLALADMDVSLEEILSDIKNSQGVDQKAQIKCDDVTDEQFELLGDAVMSLMHPDPQEHELMDQMMGGEGSDSLKATHIVIGRQYLGCRSAMMGGFGGMMFGGYGMMGGWSGLERSSLGDSKFNTLMGFGYGNDWAWLAIMFGVLVLTILVIIILMKRQTVQNKNQPDNKSWLSILTDRYAKGEISKEEFEQHKKDLS